MQLRCMALETDRDFTAYCNATWNVTMQNESHDIPIFVMPAVIQLYGYKSTI